MQQYIPDLMTFNLGLSKLLKHQLAIRHHRKWSSLPPNDTSGKREKRKENHQQIRVEGSSSQPGSRLFWLSSLQTENKGFGKFIKKYILQTIPNKSTIIKYIIRPS